MGLNDIASGNAPDTSMSSWDRLGLDGLYDAVEDALRAAGFRGDVEFTVIHGLRVNILANCRERPKRLLSLPVDEEFLLRGGEAARNAVVESMVEGYKSTKGAAHG